jgi:hypothetical protein
MRYRSLTLAAQKADGGVRRGSGDPPYNPHCAFIDFGGRPQGQKHFFTDAAQLQGLKLSP